MKTKTTIKMKNSKKKITLIKPITIPNKPPKNRAMNKNSLLKNKPVEESEKKLITMKAKWMKISKSYSPLEEKNEISKKIFFKNLNYMKN